MTPFPNRLDVSVRNANRYTSILDVLLTQENGGYQVGTTIRILAGQTAELLACKLAVEGYRRTQPEGSPERPRTPRGQAATPFNYLEAVDQILRLTSGEQPAPSESLPSLLT